MLSSKLLIVVLSLLVRIYKINNPNFVLWDEAHFGKFSLKYLKRKFYFDVHPPFGRLLTTLFGYLSEQPIDFDFKGSTKYPEEFNYVFMRSLHALISSLLPLFCELTLIELGYGKIRYLITIFLIFENGLISISRLILLDSHLMTFTSGTIYFLCKYINNKSIINMLLLGISIGCVMSIKWIGCFTTLFVGLFIIWELLILFSNYEITIWKFLKEFFIRVLFLIIIPICIYLGFFILHFSILKNHSSDSVYVNSIFDLSLKRDNDNNNKLLKYIDYGHPVSLKSELSYLHSHEYVYPNTFINQVTGYRYIDNNNDWAFQKVTDESDTEEFLHSEVDIALLHIKTKRYLGVSPIYVNKNQKRVDCRNKKLLEENIFQLEFINDWNKTESLIKTTSTSFRIRFKTDKYYYLKMTNNKYPDWGFNQFEVVFTSNKSEAGIWTIENNFKKSNSNISNSIYVELLNSKMLFFKYFKDLNISMFNINKSFIQNPDEEPARIVSKPIEWFILKRGLRMSTWDKDLEKFYMFINPFLWLLSSICICLTPLIFLYKLIIIKRYSKDITNNFKKESISFCIIFLGWILHYIPFFYVTRVCYFHHYFPSLYFSSLSIAYVFKELDSFYLIVLSILYIIIFFLYSPLTYGFRDINKIRYLQLIKTWDFI